MYERFVKLYESKGLKPSDVAKGTDLSSTVFSEWKKGKSQPNAEKLLKIAKFLGVSMEYLMTGEEPDLSQKDTNDISKKLEETLSLLESNQEALMFDGKAMDDTTRELLRISLENSLKMGKINAKEKFTPKKYKKNWGVVWLDIRGLISKLNRKFKTNSPFEIAQALNIPIIYEELGTINGYYNKPYRQKQIHINCNLNDHQRMFTCAHELGHALLHPNANTPFLINNTLLSVDKMEIEANRFAVELLITDEMIKENNNFTVSQLSKLFGLNEQLVELRIKLYWIVGICGVKLSL